MSEQKNNSLNFRVKIKNKHTERIPYFICLPKKDTLFKDAQADSPGLGTEMELKSEMKDTDSGSKSINKCLVKSDIYALITSPLSTLDLKENTWPQTICRLGWRCGAGVGLDKKCFRFFHKS